MRSLFFTAMFIISGMYLLSCKSSQQTSGENRVGIITYDQYSFRSRPVSSDTSFFVITNQQEFDRLFVLSGSLEKPTPNFVGQTVVAIGFPASSAAKIERASIHGEIMRIYASTCDAGSGGCPNNGLALATTPKSNSVKFVEFLVNDNIVEKSRVRR